MHLLIYHKQTDMSKFFSLSLFILVYRFPFRLPLDMCVIFNFLLACASFSFNHGISLQKRMEL